MAASKTTTAIELPPLDIQTIKIPLIGDTPLLVHAWSKKAREMMLAKMMKKAAPARAAKDPWSDFCQTLYWLDGIPEAPSETDVVDGRFGFPGIAFKAAAVDACTSTGAVTKVAARQAFHVVEDMVEILGPPPSMREDVTKVGMGVADVRHRGEFWPWGAIVTVRFNAGVMSAEQVVNLFNLAGFATGLGEWRAQRDGNHGSFHVAKDGEEMPCR